VIDRSRPRYLSPCTLLEQRPSGDSPCLPKGPIHASCRRLHLTQCNLWQYSLLRPYPCVWLPAACSMNSDGTWLPSYLMHEGIRTVCTYLCTHVSMHILDQASYPATCIGISNGERRNGRSAHTPGSVSRQSQAVAIAATDAIVLCANSSHRPKWAASR
jgi:hypothetical protein